MHVVVCNILSQIFFAWQIAHVILFEISENLSIVTASAGNWNVKYQWEVVTKQHALQGDGSSCGVYVMKVLIDHIIR